MTLLRILLCTALTLTSAWAQNNPNATSQLKLKEPMDINTATAAQLAILPGIGKVYSTAIVRGRPYTRKDELVSKKIVPQATYDQVKDYIIAKQVPVKPKAK